MLPTVVAEPLRCSVVPSQPLPSHCRLGHQAALCHPALQWEIRGGSGAERAGLAPTDVGCGWPP